MGLPGLKAEVERGQFTFRHPETNRPVVVFYAKSSGYDPKTPPVMVLHGVLRNPWDYRDNWIGLAEKYDLFVFVPYFREKEFPGPVGYNLGNVFKSEKRLKRNPEKEWSFRIPDIVFDYLLQSGRTQSKGYYAFGHSAGSQFLHRKLAFAPDPRLLLAVAANAGWYTFPDLKVSWPYGYRRTGIRREDLIPYLESNLLLFLGDKDSDPNDQYLRKAAPAMRQGLHRFERGHHFFEAAKEVSDAMGVSFNWDLRVVPGVGHDNAGMAVAAAAVMFEKMNERIPGK